MIDIVGEDQWSGYVGAKAPQMGMRKQLPAWFQRPREVAAAVPTTPQITEGAEGIPRVLPMPIPLTNVNAGTTQTITARAQIPLRTERLVLTSSATPSNCQVQIFVGVFPQTVTAGFVPLDVYRPGAFGVALRGNTLQVGNDLSIQVQNIGGVAETIGGAVIGTAIQP